jgi:ribosome maturation factor RimP
LGLYISGIEFSQNHKGLLVSVYLDGHNGVGIGDCAKFSRESSPVLDAEEPISGAYTLEVSSPGYDRIIETPGDFQRFQGFHIRVKIINRKKKLDGILLTSSDAGFVIQTAIEERSISFDEISTVRLHPTEEEIKRLPSLKPVDFGKE